MKIHNVIEYIYILKFCKGNKYLPNSVFYKCLTYHLGRQYYTCDV